jgi:transposase-like protein
MAKQEAVSFFEFIEKFDTEAKCREHLFKLRWPNGFKCPKCGNESYYHIKRGNHYQCRACRYQATVTAGTVMDKSHIPLVKWFWAAYLISTDKRGCSAMSLKKQLGIGYKSAWYLHKRLQTAMMERDWEYALSGTVELDDSFFGAADGGGKRGRGTGKSKVVVGLSLNREGHPKYAKMEVVENLASDSIAWFAQNNIKPGSSISTDAYSSYKRLSENGYLHEPKVFSSKDDKKPLKWLHTIVSNAKAFINGTFHGLDKKHLQFYLSEFCYRFNRRFVPEELFNSLLVSSIAGMKVRFAELTE